MINLLLTLGQVQGGLAQGIGQALFERTVYEMAAPQTIINAILDALAPLGIGAIDMPATPERIWRAIRGARF